MKIKTILITTFIISSSFSIAAQDLKIDPMMYEIIEKVSADRLEKDVHKLAGFGTRHTMSDTVSDTRGIGAAR